MSQASSKWAILNSMSETLFNRSISAAKNDALESSPWLLPAV